MATASKVHLTAGEWPEFYLPGIPQDSADAASKLLQENHDQHHIFFNSDGFHDHIAHHLLTTYALNAAPKTLQRHFDNNKSYQKPMEKPDDSVVSNMQDPAKFKSFLGKEQYYHDFLVFFQGEMEKSSWQEVLQKHVFAGDERADDMLARMFGGFLHPIIHLGFGIEFHQPAIVAEALAQAAVHTAWMRQLLVPAEKAAKEQDDKPSRSIVELLDEIHDDEELKHAPKWSDGNKVRDGIIGRAAERMVHYAAQINYKPSDLMEKTAEMTNACSYYTAGAQRSPHQIKYDFYYMHCVNCSIFYPAFLKQDWLSDANKVRLLEWKVRNDLAMYASRKNPDIKLDEIRTYRPNKPSDWDKVFQRVREFDDDGHASKLVRALAHGQKICEPYEDKPEFRIKHDDWLQMAHMAIDSVEIGEPHWVRSAGFDEAWEKIPVRAQL